MRNTVIIISNIAMLLCTVVAVFLLVNQMSFPAVILLIIAVLFFILKLVISEYTAEKKENSLHYDRTAKYMRICPACGFIGSQRSSESVPPCPKCKATLIATDTTLPEFSDMTEKQRTAWKRRWLK